MSQANELSKFRVIEKLQSFFDSVPLSDKQKAFAYGFSSLDAWEFQQKHGEYEPGKPHSYFKYLRDVREQLANLRHEVKRRKGSYSFRHAYSYVNKLTADAEMIMNLTVEARSVSGNNADNFEIKIKGDTDRKKPLCMALGEFWMIRKSVNGKHVRRAFPKVYKYYNNPYSDYIVSSTVEGMQWGSSVEQERTPVGLVLSVKPVEFSEAGFVYAAKYLQRRTREKLSGYVVGCNGMPFFALVEDKAKALEALNLAIVSQFEKSISE